MSTTHYLKIHPLHYYRVWKGTKTFEIRENDRYFQKGDTVILRVWSPETKDYVYPEDSKRNLEFTIGDVYPIDERRVVFSLLKDSE